MHGEGHESCKQRRTILCLITQVLVGVGYLRGDTRDSHIGALQDLQL